MNLILCIIGEKVGEIDQWPRWYSNIIMLFDDLAEPEMFAIVTDILHHKDTNQYEQLVQSIECASKQNGRAYIHRVITGKLAEKFFEDDFKTNPTLPKGVLKDCRDNGCGYDYEILSQDGFHILY